MARLKTTPALRHCETSQGRYMAVLIQTEVKEVALSMPGLSSDFGTSRNCDHEYIDGASMKLEKPHIRQQILPPRVRREFWSRGSYVFLSIVYLGSWKEVRSGKKPAYARCALLWKWMPASGWFWARSRSWGQVFLSHSAASVPPSETLSPA